MSPKAQRVSELARAFAASAPFTTVEEETQLASALTSMRYVIARRAFDSDAAMADTLGVHRSRVTRWKRGATPDPEHAGQLLALDVVVSLLMGFLDNESIPKWLRGINAHLGDRRPIDVLTNGQLSDVIRAIEAERTGAFA